MLRVVILAASIGLLAACAATEQEAVPSEPVSPSELETLPDPAQSANEDKSSETSEYTRIRFGLDNREDEPSIADRARCEDAGGAVRRVGLRGILECVQTYPDAGKVCRDSDECLGSCTTVDGNAVGKPGTGTCQEVDVPFGCYAFVEDGRVDGGMLCVD